MSIWAWRGGYGWTKTNIDNVVYIWDGASNNYALYQNGGTYTLNGSRYIAPGQGFFVKANNTGASLSMANAIRTTESSTFRDVNSNDVNTLKLYVSNKYGKDEVAILFDDSKLENAEKLFTTDENAPSLYLVNNDKDYSIMNLGESVSYHSQPMSFESGAGGVYTIYLNSDVSYFDFLELEDLQEGLKVNLLKEDSYTFAGNLGDSPERFRINFIIGEEDIEHPENDIFAYLIYDDLIVKNIEGRGSISIIDLQGRVLNVYEAKESFRKNLGLSCGVYIVKLIDDSGVKFMKIRYKVR